MARPKSKCGAGSSRTEETGAESSGERENLTMPASSCAEETGREDPGEREDLTVPADSLAAAVLAFFAGGCSGSAEATAERRVRFLEESEATNSRISSSKEDIYLFGSGGVMTGRHMKKEPAFIAAISAFVNLGRQTPPSAEGPVRGTR